MKRKSTKEQTSLKSWDEVNEKLHRIAEINAVTKKFKAQADLKHLSIDKQLEGETSSLLDEKLSVERDIELYCKDHRDEFANARTRTLNFGLVQLRWLPERVVVLAKWTIDKVIEEIKRQRITSFIRVKEELNRDEIKAAYLGENGLRKLGLALKQDEEFYYEAFEKDLPGMG